jgi:Spy/CpxP family protein refolding chaperone
MKPCVRSASAAVIVATLTLVTTCLGAARAAAPAALATATPGSRAATTPAAPRARLMEHVWWNQPELVQALQLRDDQRSQMDKLLAQALQELRESQHKQMERRIAFEQALVQGDWSAARKTAAELREGVSETAAPQTTLKVDVLSLLDDSQRQTLVAQYAYLLRRPWVVPSSMAGIPVRTPRGPIK